MQISIEAQNKYTGSIPICPLLMFKISVDNAIERKQLIFVYYWLTDRQTNWQTQECGQMGIHWIQLGWVIDGD